MTEKFKCPRSEDRSEKPTAETLMVSSISPDGEFRFA